MRRVPNGVPVLDQKRLWRFMPHLETFGDCIRQSPIFNNEHHSAKQIAGPCGEIRELLVRLRADRTLRAMLENEDGIGLRFL